MSTAAKSLANRLFQPSTGKISPEKIVDAVDAVDLVDSGIIQRLQQCLKRWLIAIDFS